MMSLYRPVFCFGGANVQSFIARSGIANCPSIECANRTLDPVIHSSLPAII